MYPFPLQYHFNEGSEDYLLSPNHDMSRNEAATQTDVDSISKDSYHCADKLGYLKAAVVRMALVLTSSPPGC